MKLSIIIAVYQSYGAVERQLKHFNRMALPDDIEIIIVDDGSDPPITPEKCKNLTIHRTHEKRAWTQGLARNEGAALARGEYIFFTDIDHILSRAAIMDAYRFTGDRLIFPRYLGVLDESGEFSQDPQVLEHYGADLNRRRGLWASYHGNTFCIKKSTFLALGGYREKHCTREHHARERKGEDSYFNREWNRWARERGIKVQVGPAIYIFPIGRFHKEYNLNPFGLFHNLSYEPTPQPNKI